MPTAVDPKSGDPITEPGAVGENVITSYTHFAQPFIKYRTHDLVRRDDHPDHGCGWTWAHLPGVVLGRVDFRRRSQRARRTCSSP